MGEVDEVDLCIGVEAQKLLIDAIAFAVLRRGHDAGDVRLDIHGVEPVHDAHALVAFDDVELIVVFQRDDGLAQTIRDDAVVKNRPFICEFGIRFKQGQEAAGERGCAPLCCRSGNLIQRNLHQSQRHLRQLIQLRHKLGEYGQVRVLTTRFKRVQFLDAFFSSGNIILKHGDRFLSSSLLIFLEKIVSIWLCAANRGAARMQPISFPSL